MVLTRFQLALCGIGLSLLAACAVPSATSNPTARVAGLPAAASHEELAAPSVLDELTKDTAVAATASPAVTTPQTVRVLLVESKNPIYIKHTGRVNIFTQDLTKKYKVSQSGTLAVKMPKKGQLQVGTLQAAQPIIIAPVAGTRLEINKISYTGTLHVLPATERTFYIVEYTPLEEYLYGVLPYEMHHTWHLEALKAQAVAARTYTLKSIAKKANEPFDLYSDVRSQMYKGSAQVYDSIKQAVDQTRGEVLVYKGELFFTYYHGNCGGGTDKATIWNPKAASIKPLAGASCKFDNQSKSYTFKQSIAKSAVEKFAHGHGLKGSLKSMKIAQKTGTGRAVTLTLKTNQGSKTFPCADVRIATGMRSCKLTKISTGTTTVQLEGRGYGHGIGMCQDGAHGMAKQNYTYKQILKHYYPSSTLYRQK